MAWGFWQVIIALVIFAIILYWIKKSGKKEVLAVAKSAGEIKREFQGDMKDATENIKSVADSFKGNDK